MKDVVGYEGKYKISQNGVVWSYPNRQTRYKWKEKATYIGTRGYVNVTLYHGKKSCSYPIHVLIAKAYISNPENKKIVNHKDGNKLNNDIENLEWVTTKENDVHAQMLGLRPQYTEKQKAARRTSGLRSCRQNAKKLRKITFGEAECIRIIKKYCKVSYLKLGKLYGLSDKTIAAICKYEIYKD